MVKELNILKDHNNNQKQILSNMVSWENHVVLDKEMLSLSLFFPEIYNDFVFF